VHAYVIELRDARLTKLVWAHGVIVAGFRYHVSIRGNQGRTLAELALAIMREDICHAKQQAVIDRHVARLNTLELLVPHTPLSLRPFVDTVAAIFPAVGDTAGAVAAGLYLAPTAGLDSVPAVVAYGKAVATARRQHLDRCQMRIAAGYRAFTDRMRRRAFALSEATAARVLAIGGARSEATLDRLVLAVAGLVRKVPASYPAPTVFLESLRIELEALESASSTLVDTPSVNLVAEAERTKRLASLRVCAARMSTSYLGYRARMLLRGRGLAHVTTIVFTTMCRAHSDWELARLEARLDVSRSKLPSLPDVVQAYLDVRVLLACLLVRSNVCLLAC
jgi:hypothetical protein